MIDRVVVYRIKHNNNMYKPTTHNKVYRFIIILLLCSVRGAVAHNIILLLFIINARDCRNILL